MTDAALAAAAAAGDRDAAGALVRRYYQDCWRFAYRMMGHRHDAEDVIQETFLRVFRSLGGYREQDRFRPWLFRILTNVCRTALLQRRRRARWFLSDIRSERVLQLASADEPPLDEVSECARHAALAVALQAAILQLDPKQREAFLLKCGEGMEYVEMAEITGVGVSALKMRVKRACHALRPLLGEVVLDG
jgi:RNA polymerase sigma-70 factor (ECF subfamily)